VILETKECIKNMTVHILQSMVLLHSNISIRWYLYNLIFSCICIKEPAIFSNILYLSCRGSMHIKTE
jgi:hypothetical protein